MYDRTHKTGFTIVELLIVIVVIAILATISVAAYRGIQNRAYDSSVQSDLKSLASKLEVFKIDSPTSVYPNANSAATTQLTSLNFKASKSAYETSGTTHNLNYCFSADLSQYIVVALSKSGAVFYISSNTKSPHLSSGAWDTGEVASCTNAESGITISNALRGYAAADTTTGPWRAWAGGN